MDDDAFKTELLSRMERMQSLLSYLCAAAKASEERAQAEIASKKRSAPDQVNGLETPERSLLQDEMQDDYQQAVNKWRSGKV
jgi:hypothetical protein